MRSWIFWVAVIGIFASSQGIKAVEEQVDQAVSFPSEVGGWKWDGKKGNYDSRTIFH
jgi:hypothetical protein